MPSDYIGDSGFRLGDWLVRQRRSRNMGELSDEKVKLLDKIGFSWQSESVWDEGYRHAKAYYDKNGTLIYLPLINVRTAMLWGFGYLIAARHITE